MTWQRRARAIVASTLLVIGAFGVVLSSVGQWASDKFLSTKGFTSSADATLDRKAVQDALARALVRQIEEKAGRDLKLADPFVRSIVEGIVSSDAFHEVFDRSVSSAHHVFVTRNAEELALNLSSTLDDIRSVLKEVAPGLANDLPPGNKLRITLAKRTQLPVVWDWVQRVNTVIDTLPYATIAIIGIGLLVAPLRWRALALLGWTTAGLSVVFLIVLGVTRQQLLNRISDTAFREGAASAWNVLSHDLLWQTIIVAIVFALVAVIARWTDRNGGVAVYPVAWRRTWQSARTVAATGVGIAEDEPLVPALTGLAASAIRWRLPAPDHNPRLTHAWRAVGLGIIGIVVLASPDFVVSALLFLLAIALLYLAFTEGLASYRSPHAVAPDHPSLSR